MNVIEANALIQLIQEISESYDPPEVQLEKLHKFIETYTDTRSNFRIVNSLWHIVPKFTLQNVDARHVNVMLRGVLINTKIITKELLIKERDIYDIAEYSYIKNNLRQAIYNKVNEQFLKIP